MSMWIRRWKSYNFDNRSLIITVKDKEEKMSNNWISVLGEFEQSNGEITFRGKGQKDPVIGKEFPAIGNYICDHNFSGGELSAIVKFPKLTKDIAACGIMFCYDTDQRYFVVATIGVREGAESAFELQHFDKKWTLHDFAGHKSSIKANEEYKLKVKVEGSTVEVCINNVSVIRKNLPFQLPRKQVGLWCQGVNDIVIKDFLIKETPAKAFVIMQFSAPYNELFEDVIKPLCKEKNIIATRADESYGPGYILSDIMSDIYSAKFIIAEITPSNQNVFFEVGYAHAMKKPIIFIAEKGKELPFDVSGFRALFYENSIRGKKDILDGLRKNIDAILSGPFV